jgi:hypothetical protein
MGLVAQHSCYAWAAGKYKERAGDVIADRQLERIRKAATATLLATASQPRDDESMPYKKTLLWLVALLVMLVLGLLFMKIVASNTRPKPPTPVRQ